MKKLLAFLLFTIFSTFTVGQAVPQALKVNSKQFESLEVEAAMYSYNQDNTMTAVELLDDLKRLKHAPTGEWVLMSRVQLEIWCANPPYRKIIEKEALYKCVAPLEITPVEMEELTVRYRQRRARILTIIDQPPRKNGKLIN